MGVMGRNIVFGVVELKQLQGVPHSAKVRFKMRNDNFLKAFIRDAKGVTQYYVEIKDGQWFLCYPSARNVVVRV